MVMGGGGGGSGKETWTTRDHLIPMLVLDQLLSSDCSVRCRVPDPYRYATAHNHDQLLFRTVLESFRHGCGLPRYS
jgi:hypothetical protein